MVKEIIYFFVIVFLLAGSFSLGWMSNDLWDEDEKVVYKNTIIKSNKRLDGCWQRIRKGNVTGDWVCVNVEDMSYERAVEVCQHEVGHEIFAEECEKNFTKCLNVMDG